MTTVAANRRVMAADTLVTHGTVSFRASKLFVIGDTILGAAGKTSDINKFMEWFRAGRPAEAPQLSHEDPDETGLEVLALNRDGLFLYTACCAPDPIEDKCYAIGSGGAVALAAMRQFSFPPENAVKFAAAVDNATNDRVEVRRLADVKRQKARS